MGEQTLKNIARPVRVFQVRLGGRTESDVDDVPLEALAMPNKPSIAVLPFTNMSGDPEQEYFADGLVEDVITYLSKIPSLFVIARNSTFAYKGRAVDIRKVAAELGVRYVLEGSVRRAANRLRITGQLIEGAAGTHVWADKFEGAAEDIFDLQDRLTESIVGAIEPSIRRAEIERARRKRPDSLDAYDLYLQAMPHAYMNTAEGASRHCDCSERRCGWIRTTRLRTPMRPGAMNSASFAADSIRRTGRRRCGMPQSRSALRRKTHRR